MLAKFLARSLNCSLDRSTRPRLIGVKSGALQSKAASVKSDVRSVQASCLLGLVSVIRMLSPHYPSHMLLPSSGALNNKREQTQKPMNLCLQGMYGTSPPRRFLTASPAFVLHQVCSKSEGLREEREYKILCTGAQPWPRPRPIPSLACSLRYLLRCWLSPLSSLLSPLSSLLSPLSALRSPLLFSPLLFSPLLFYLLFSSLFFSSIFVIIVFSFLLI